MRIPAVAAWARVPLVAWAMTRAPGECWWMGPGRCATRVCLPVGVYMYLGVSGFGLTSAFALSSWFDPRAVPIRFATYAVLATCTSFMFEVDRSGTDGVNEETTQ